MIVRIDKGYSRNITVGLEQLDNRMSPIGFTSEDPKIHYALVRPGKFGVTVEGSQPFDIVIYQDNVRQVQRQSLEEGVKHTIHRTDGGLPLVFAAEKADLPIAPGAGTPLFDQPEATTGETSLMPEQPYIEGTGLVLVFVRISHRHPDQGPDLPPDEFTRVIFQLNEYEGHAAALANNLDRLVQAPDLTAEDSAT